MALLKIVDCFSSKQLFVLTTLLPTVLSGPIGSLSWKSPIQEAVGLDDALPYNVPLYAGTQNSASHRTQTLSIREQLEAGIRMLHFDLVRLEGVWRCKGFDSATNMQPCRRQIGALCYSNCPFVITDGNPLAESELKPELAIVAETPRSGSSPSSVGTTKTPRSPGDPLSRGSSSYPERLFGEVADFLDQHPREIVTIFFTGSGGNFPEAEEIVNRLKAGRLWNRIWNQDAWSEIPYVFIETHNDNNPIPQFLIRNGVFYPTLGSMRRQKRSVMLFNLDGTGDGSKPWGLSTPPVDLRYGEATIDHHENQKCEVKMSDTLTAATMRGLQKPFFAVLDRRNLIPPASTIPRLNIRSQAAKEFVRKSVIPYLHHKWDAMLSGSQQKQMKSNNMPEGQFQQDSSDVDREQTDVSVDVYALLTPPVQKINHYGQHPSSHSNRAKVNFLIVNLFGKKDKLIHDVEEVNRERSQAFVKEN